MITVGFNKEIKEVDIVKYSILFFPPQKKFSCRANTLDGVVVRKRDLTLLTDYDEGISR